jgi:NDP-sugar pyrophosphorylase family protein
MLPIAILAGGLATRLGTLTENVPKCMLEVNGFPFIHWQIELLKAAGYRDFMFCLAHKSDVIQEYLGDGSRYGVNFEFSMDGATQLGTGGAIVKAAQLLGEEFAVIYGDSYLPINYQDFEMAFKSSNSVAMMSLFKNNSHIETNNAELLSDGNVDYRKGTFDFRKTYIDYGISYFKKEAFKDYHPNQPVDLAEICQILSINKKLTGYEVFQRYYEVGSYQGIEEFSNYLLEVDRGL